MGFHFWKSLNSGDQKSFEIYRHVMQKVYEKFESRTWENTALKFDTIFKSLMRGEYNVEAELTVL